MGSLSTWTVEVVAYDGLGVVRRLRCSNERAADTAERGLLRNMNVADYFTRIVPPTPPSTQPKDPK